MPWTGKCKFGAIAGVRVGKYNLGTRAGKCKVSVRVGKHKLAVNTNWGPGPGANQRAGGQKYKDPYKKATGSSK